MTTHPKSFFDGGIVDWTDTAHVHRPDGSWCNPFMEYTYAARVRFDDDYVVIVSLFPGAAYRRMTEYTKLVVAAAVAAKNAGERLAEVTV